MAKTPALQLPHSSSVTSRETLHQKLTGKLETLQVVVACILSSRRWKINPEQPGCAPDTALQFP